MDRLARKKNPSPIYLHAIVFWDEKHKKQVLGPMSNYQYRIYRNEDGMPISKAEGGKLSAMQCRTSLKYAEEARGCFGVVIHIIREYQDGINKRYWFTVVGDSPELARALDSFGFADLDLSMAFHQALTSGWAANNPKKFQFGTPSQVRSAMSRCWEVEPTSERIVQDIIDLPRVLQKIIDAKGTVVYGEALRNGHRARRADGKGTMKGNLSSSRRKSTLSLRPIHPDARSALDAILGEEEAVIEETIESVENLINACHDEHERDTSEIFEDVIEDVDILASYLNVE